MSEVSLKLTEVREANLFSERLAALRVVSLVTADPLDFQPGRLLDDRVAFALSHSR